MILHSISTSGTTGRRFNKVSKFDFKLQHPQLKPLKLTTIDLHKDLKLKRTDRGLSKFKK
jgi:hypothetical protein